VLKVRLLEQPLVLALLIGFGLWILLRLVEQTLWVWVLVLLGTILASAMKPIVDLARKPALPPSGWHLPSGVAVVIVYLAILATVVLGTYIVGILVSDELLALSGQLPAFGAPLPRLIQDLARALNVPPSLIPSEAVLADELRRVGSTTVGIAATIVPSFVTFVVRFFIVLTFAAFLVVEWDEALCFFVSLFPPSRQATVSDVLTRSSTAMGHWVLGALAESSIIGVLGGLAAAILGLPFPVIIGIVTGLVELLPMVGPMLMMLPAFALGLLQSPLVAVLSALAFFLISQVDASIIAPSIARWAVHLSPLVAIIAIPLGAALYGAVGALIAIPVAAALQIFANQVILPWLRRIEGAAPGEDTA